MTAPVPVERERFAAMLDELVYGDGIRARSQRDLELRAACLAAFEGDESRATA